MLSTQTTCLFSLPAHIYCQPMAKKTGFKNICVHLISVSMWGAKRTVFLFLFMSWQWGTANAFLKIVYRMYKRDIQAG